MRTVKRCPWMGDDPIMLDYHDKEWGMPAHDDRRHFEYLLLDAFQAGLSWRTVLHKRENFRKAFSDFNPARIARYDGKKLTRLMHDEGIIRNRLKIHGAVKNAKAFLRTQDEFGSFDEYIWRFTDYATLKNPRHTFKEVPARTKESDAMSRDLKKRGFTFVGSTICYAYMQAAGLVNDHLVECFRYRELA